jgi:hypothetical protein
MATSKSTSGGNSVTNAQWSATTEQTMTLTVAKLQPGQTYNLAVRNETTTGNSDYVVVQYTVPSTDASGSSTTVYNNGQDLRLQGGSIFATTTGSDALPKSLGKIDIMNSAPSGTGIIINQYGVAAFKNGVPEFRLNAQTGAATFSGTVQAGSIQIGPDVGPSHKKGIYLNATNYWYDDGTWSATPDQISGALTGTNALKPGAPTSLVGVWVGQNFQLTFNFNVSTKTDIIDNTHVVDFIITHYLTDGSKKSVKVRPDGDIAQAYSLSYTSNESLFGKPQSSFLKIEVAAEDAFGNIGPSASISGTSLPNYSNPLPVPTISASGINYGYTVQFTNYPDKATYPAFDHVVIEEYVSNTDPGAVTYTQVYSGTLNPVTILRSDQSKRYVRARYADVFGNLTSPSTAYPISPNNPVASGLNLTPPNDVTVGTVEWVGNEIDIHYQLPNTSPGNRFVITLSTNYAPYNTPPLSGFFYKYPTPDGIVKITQDDLFGQFGDYYTGYTGLIRSADAQDNRSAGTSFVVPPKQSSLTSLTPDLAAINVFGVTNGYAVQPYLVSGASTMEIYESTTSTGPWNKVASTSQIFSKTTSDYNIRYLKFRWAGAFGDFSQYSAVTNVTPVNPTAFNTTPPGTPSIGQTDNTTTTITVAIDTIDPTNTKGYFLQYYPSNNTGNVTSQTLPYNGSGTVTYTINNLTPGQQYYVKVQAYSQTNITGNYSSPVLVSTLSSTVSPPTSVLLSGLTYGALATWTAPTNPVTPIASYGVALYTSAGALFTEQYTTGTTYSLSGLKANTSYYVKVYAKDIYGVESSSVQSNTITLNAVGNTTNGLVPSSSPAPTVTPLYGALEIKWSPITNIDLTTYEVHVSTTNNFTPTTSTKALETEGTFAIIKTLPGVSTSLTYGITYYVTIVAKDFDGSNPGPYTYASATTLQVDNGDIAANAVRANQIQAGVITGNKMVTDVLFAAQTINVGQSTSANKITLDANVIAQNTTGYTNPSSPIYGRMYIGTGLYNDPGTSVYFDNLGRMSLKSALTFDGTNLTVNGQIVAQSGYFNGAITVNGLNPATAMKIGRLVDAVHDGLYLDANNYWFTNGAFSVGSGTLGFSWNGSNTFNVTGNITANSGTFKGAITVDAVANNAGLWIFPVVGGVTSTYTTGPRIAINKNGIYAYDYGAISTTAPSTSINIAGASGTTTFQTTNASIGGWTIDSAKIENSITVGGATSFFGMASTGNYVFYAGSSGTAGNSTAKFLVSPSGTVIARDIQIIGNGSTTALTIGGTTYAGAPFAVDAAGNMKATQATITGNITAISGTFTGNVNIGTAGSVYMGSVILPGATGNSNTYPLLSSSGFIINTKGMTFSDGTSYVTTIDAATGALFTSSATIANWTINSSQITKNGITLDTNINNATGIATKYAGITATDGSYYVGIAAPQSSSDIVLWAGNFNYASRASANFRVDSTGKLYATGAEISGKIVISSGATYDSINTATTTASNASTAATNASTAATNASTAATNAANAAAAAAVTANNALPASSFSKSAIIGKINNSTNTTTIDGGILTTGTVVADNVVSTYVYAGAISANQINAGTITADRISGGTMTGSDISIAGDTNSNRFRTSYNRTTPGGSSTISSLGINAIAMISATTAGVVSSWYPWSEDQNDLGLVGIRWRNLRYYGALTTTSDRRVKKDIAESDLGLDFIKDLKPVKYKKIYKTEVPKLNDSGEIKLDQDGNRVIDYIKTTEGDRFHYGFIAQEVKESLDKFGVGDKFAGWLLDDLNDPDSRQGLAYDDFISPITKAIQEMSDKIDSLQAELDSLKK